MNVNSLLNAYVALARSLTSLDLARSVGEISEAPPPAHGDSSAADSVPGQPRLPTAGGGSSRATEGASITGSGIAGEGDAPLPDAPAAHRGGRLTAAASSLTLAGLRAPVPSAPMPVPAADYMAMIAGTAHPVEEGDIGGQAAPTKPRPKDNTQAASRAKPLPPSPILETAPGGTARSWQAAVQLATPVDIPAYTDDGQPEAAQESRRQENRERPSRAPWGSAGLEASRVTRPVAEPPAASSSGTGADPTSRAGSGSMRPHVHPGAAAEAVENDSAGSEDDAASDRPRAGRTVSSADPLRHATGEAARKAAATFDANSDATLPDDRRPEPGGTPSRTPGLPGRADASPPGQPVARPETADGSPPALARGDSREDSQGGTQAERPGADKAGAQTSVSAESPSAVASRADAARQAAPRDERVATSGDRAAALTPSPDRLAPGLRPDLLQRPLLDGLAPGPSVPTPGMEAIILNAAMVPGWPAPRPFEMPRRLPADGRQQPAPAREPAQPENGSTRTGREEVAIQAYLANMGVKRSLLARIRAALRPVRQRARIMFGLAVLATQVVFTLHTVFSEIDSVEHDEDEVERQPGDQQRRLRG